MTAATPGADVGSPEKWRLVVSVRVQMNFVFPGQVRCRHHGCNDCYRVLSGHSITSPRPNIPWFCKQSCLMLVPQSSNPIPPNPYPSLLPSLNFSLPPPARLYPGILYVNFLVKFMSSVGITILIYLVDHGAGTWAGCTERELSLCTILAVIHPVLPFLSLLALPVLFFLLWLHKVSAGYNNGCECMTDAGRDPNPKDRELGCTTMPAKYDAESHSLHKVLFGIISAIMPDVWAICVIAR